MSIKATILTAVQYGLEAGSKGAGGGCSTVTIRPTVSIKHNSRKLVFGDYRLGDLLAGRGRFRNRLNWLMVCLRHRRRVEDDSQRGGGSVQEPEKALVPLGMPKRIVLDTTTS